MNGLPPPKTATLFPLVPQGESVLLPAIARLGISILIFGAVFCLMSIGLTSVVSPDRFPVKVGENTVRVADLEEEERRLKVKYAELIEARVTLLNNSDAPVLRQVEALRSGVSPVGSVLLGIEDVRRSFRVADADPIAIPTVNFSFERRTVTLGGEVQDAAGRSMQILASFVDGLRAIPSVASVSEPEYRMTTLQDGGTSSPFTITVGLR